MCGIAGLLRPGGGGDESRLSDIAKHMTDALAYRGPDASGYWTNAPAGVAFGHRRLSVLDLSQAGSQPMHSDCGRFTVTFNGEIYNHLDINWAFNSCIQMQECMYFANEKGTMRSSSFSMLTTYS